MTVSAGVGGTGVVGVVLGGGGTAAADKTPKEAAVDMAGALPYTGATDLMLMIAASMLVLVLGFLVLGLAKRRNMTE